MNTRMIAACAVGALALTTSIACSEKKAATASSVSTPIVLGNPAADHPDAVLVDLYQGGQLQAYCSGSVIAPYVVLTAGHCVDGFDTWQVAAPGANGQSAASSNGVLFDWGGNGTSINPAQHDVGLVILSSPIKLASYPTLATSPVPNGTPVVNVGRVQDGTLSSTALYESMPLEVIDAAPSGLPFDYLTMDAIQAGDSGGPDYWSTPAGPVLVAVNSGATSTHYYAVLARVDLVSAWLQSQLAAYPAGLPYAPPDAGAEASTQAGDDGGEGGSDAGSE
jgi:secreted trypsin-like serine protease